MAADRTETLTCTSCQRAWVRGLTRGTKPTRCPSCRRPSPGQRLASRVTTYRLAIETARAALRLGRYDDALAHLDAAVRSH